MPKANQRLNDAVFFTVHPDHNPAKADGQAKPLIKQLASEMGISAQVLNNKACHTAKRHHLHLDEALRLMALTEDYQILDVMAAEVGGSFIPNTALSKDAPSNVMGDVAKMSGDFGQLMQEIAADLADGNVSRQEMVRIEAKAQELRRALDVLLRDMRAEARRRETQPG